MNTLFVGATGGMLAVALSAFGAHALQSTLSQRAMESYQTAADYQFYHSLALAFVAVLSKFYAESRLLNWSARLFTVGLFLFCGSLYLLPESASSQPINQSEKPKHQGFSCKIL